MTDQIGQQEALEPEMSGAAGQESGAPVQDTGATDAIAVEDVTSREELEQLYEESLKHIQEGEIVRGRVVHISRDSVLVDVGYKSEGTIDLEEFPDHGRYLQVGEEVRQRAKEKTLASLAEGQIIEGVVKNITEYGAFIDLGGIDGLLHITDMSWGRVGHPSELFAIGDKIRVMVLKFDQEHERV